MKEKNKKVGQFTIKMDDCLGRGGFATTYKAFRDKNYNQPFACKIIQKQDIQKVLKAELAYFIKRVQQQYKALQSLKHPNIVNFLDIQQTTNNLYLFFEYCEEDMEKYIQNHQFDRNQQDIYQLAKQIISACTYFTAKGFLHRDIKPANILLKNKQVKIADFGLATQIVDVQKSVTFAGTPQYMAPQILKQSVKMKEIGKCDVWSVGVTLYQLCTGQLPFGISKKDQSDKKIMMKIQNQKIEMKETIHPLLQKLIRGTLVYQPKDRMTFQQANKMILTYESEKN